MTIRPHDDIIPGDAVVVRWDDYKTWYAKNIPADKQHNYWGKADTEDFALTVAAIDGERAWAEVYYGTHNIAMPLEYLHKVYVSGSPRMECPCCKRACQLNEKNIFVEHIGRENGKKCSGSGTMPLATSLDSDGAFVLDEVIQFYKLLSQRLWEDVVRFDWLIQIMRPNEINKSAGQQILDEIVREREQAGESVLRIKSSPIVYFVLPMRDERNVWLVYPYSDIRFFNRNINHPVWHTIATKISQQLRRH